MAVGLVFFYFAILLYAALLLPFGCLAVYALFHWRRSTAFALLGLVAWLFVAPILALVVLLLLDPAEPQFRNFILIGYSAGAPLFLVPLAFALFAPSKPLGTGVQPA